MQKSLKCMQNVFDAKAAELIFLSHDLYENKSSQEFRNVFISGTTTKRKI